MSLEMKSLPDDKGEIMLSSAIFFPYHTRWYLLMQDIALVVFGMLAVLMLIGFVAWLIVIVLLTILLLTCSLGVLQPATRKIALRLQLEFVHLKSILKEGSMAHLIYDSDQRSYGDSAGYNGPRSTDYNGPRFNGGFALLAIVILLILVFWADLPQLRSNLNSAIIPAVNNSVTGPITDNRYVIADNLNMREEPVNGAQVNYVLPRGTTVTLLGESHEEMDGDVWLKVSVETSEGRQIGWVRRRYVT